MKSLVLAIVLLGSGILLNAQTGDGTARFDGHIQPALIVNYEYAPAVVKDAYVKKMQESGNKSSVESGLFNKDKGAIVFKNAVIKEISEMSYDYIVTVDSKRGGKSVLYFMINKDGNSVMNTMDPNALARAREFLNTLAPNVGDANLEFQIKNQEEVVLKSEKRYKSLTDDRADMEKKIAKLQEDLVKNKKDMEDQQKDSETQRQALDLLKGKRRTPVVN